MFDHGEKEGQRVLFTLCSTSLKFELSFHHSLLHEQDLALNHVRIHMKLNQLYK